jgi:hypothetical protein
MNIINTNLGQLNLNETNQSYSQQQHQMGGIDYQENNQSLIEQANFNVSAKSDSMYLFLFGWESKEWGKQNVRGAEI